MNYSWDAGRKRQINIKQQNAVRSANSDPKIAKTRGFPIDLSCCGSSTSTEVNCYYYSCFFCCHYYSCFFCSYYYYSCFFCCYSFFFCCYYYYSSSLGIRGDTESLFFAIVDSERREDYIYINIYVWFAEFLRILPLSRGVKQENSNLIWLLTAPATTSAIYTTTFTYYYSTICAEYNFEHSKDWWVEPEKSSQEWSCQDPVRLPHLDWQAFASQLAWHRADQLPETDRPHNWHRSVKKWEHPTQGARKKWQVSVINYLKLSLDNCGKSKSWGSQ